MGGTSDRFRAVPGSLPFARMTSTTTALSLLVWSLVSAVGCRAQEKTPFSRVSCRACINPGNSKYCVTPQGAYCDGVCYYGGIDMENRLDCLFASRRGGLWFSGIFLVAVVVLCWKVAKHCKSCGPTSTTAASVEPPGIRGGRTGTPRFGGVPPNRTNNPSAAAASPSVVPMRAMASPELTDHDANGSDNA
jgi:hypothetical protein